MREKRPDEQNTDIELDLELELCTIKILDNYGRFMAAKQAFIDVIAEVMLGEGESMKENIQYLTLLLRETALNFAQVVQSGETNQDQRDLLEQLMIQTNKDVNECLDRCDASGLSIKYDEDTETEVIDAVLSENDPDEQADVLKELFSEMYGSALNTILPYAPVNKKGVLREQRKQRNMQSLHFAAEAGKVALSAIVAVAAARLFNGRSDKSIE